MCRTLWLFCLASIVAALSALQSFGAQAPSYLPHYDVAINLDIEGHKAHVAENITWLNRHKRATNELVFNFHSAYEAPSGGLEQLFLAKMLEIVRVSPSEGIYPGNCVSVHRVMLIRRKGEDVEHIELPFHFMQDLKTAMVVNLPEEVNYGQSVTVCVEFRFDLPQKQGRWGQWKGITVLSNWLPVLAYFDDTGWQPTPFVPWHQPFFNEAGVYDVHIRLPSDHKVGSSGSIRERKVDGGFQELWIGPVTTREFTIVTSSLFQEHSEKVGDVTVTCLHLPEHAFYGEKIAQISARAVGYYTKWFGPYANKELVLAESYFGWNGNECSGLIMIDERVFGMPHLGTGYVEYLVSHETCHQWFYNMIGTDGYRETFMDEAFATYFAHRLLNDVHGKNNTLFKYPEVLKWLPNVQREDYRYGHFYGTIGRNDLAPPVQDMLKYGHVGNLFSAAYDRGNKIVGMIEERLGEAAFFDFMRGIYQKYFFKVIFVDDFQHELEAYTGRSWGEFFKNWLHDKGMTDWSVESVRTERIKKPSNTYGLHPDIKSGPDPYRAEIFLRQKSDFDEPTTLGVSFGDNEKYTVRIPIVPQQGSIQLVDPPGQIEVLQDHLMRIELELAEKPTQIAVDPDQILPDKNPANNYWRPRYRFRVTPLYTFLDETDLTGAYDRWNFTVGPWAYGPSYSDPWFTRATVLGVRAGAYRTEEFTGGVYAGYRTDFKDIAVGMDALWNNLLYPRIDTGIHAEKAIVDINSQSSMLDRAVIYNRYVINDTSSMYQAPMHYVEAFTAWQHNFLPTPRYTVAGAEHFNDQTNLGLHYHADFLSPYWNPDRGFKVDMTYAAGLPILGQPEGTNQATGQISWVHKLPEGLGYFSESRLAYRVFGAFAYPTNAVVYSLGGNMLFRGFDLSERQGSAMWIGSMEWRLPIIQDVEWDAVDHVVGLRNLYAAPFCDVGNAYINQAPLGSTAVAVGGGIRAEFSWLSFLERTTFRLDFAKTVNATSPWQMWVNIQNPF